MEPKTSGINRQPGAGETLFGTYDRGIVKVVAFASAVIIFSMLIVGTIAYFVTEREVVKKLKERDLPVIAQAIGAQVDGRINRAIESSLAFAHDPTVIRWVAGGEKDTLLQEDITERMHRLATEFDYSNTFLVSAITRHYWGETKSIIGTVSESEPNDAWFFQTLKDNKPVTVVVDYNKERKDTFVFVNTIVSDGSRPIAVAGVGMSLGSLARSFSSFQFEQGGSLWLVDSNGNVVLSNQENDAGKALNTLLPEQVAEKLLDSGDSSAQVSEFKSRSGGLSDLIRYPIESSNLVLIYQVPRAETVSFLRSIKVNTGIATAIAVVSIVFFFRFVSRRLANPYKRVLELNKQLELKVQERTRDLAEKNEKIMDSIDYAKRIQTSLLPTSVQLSGGLAEYAVIWRPRDIVGGDFYWMKPMENGMVLAVGDCSGHGVPGALMSMLAVTALDQIVERGITEGMEPAHILDALHKRIKATLQQNSKQGLTDDGLDIGLCYLHGDMLHYAGARVSLYCKDERGIRLLEGNSRSVGYRRVPADYHYQTQQLRVHEGMQFYMSTDGLFDQNGGEHNYSYGRKRFRKLLEEHPSESISGLLRKLENALGEYAGSEPQRDDITVFGFRFRTPASGDQGSGTNL